MNDGPDLFVHKAVRLKKFSVEMLPYNASDALKGLISAQPIESQKERERNWQRSSLAEQEPGAKNPSVSDKPEDNDLDTFIQNKAIHVEMNDQRSGFVSRTMATSPLRMRTGT